MSNTPNNSAPVNDLNGLLREAVERICATDVPSDRMEACLDRVAEWPPGKVAGDRVTMHSPPATGTTRTRSMRRWIGLAATAAVVVALAVIQWRSTSVSLADVAQVVGRQPWIHVNISTSEGESEAWYSPTTDVSATRRADWIAYHDHKLKVYHSYDVVEGVLYRVPEIGSASHQNGLTDMINTLRLLLADGDPPDDPLSKMEFLGSLRSELTLLKQQMKEVADSGRDWLDYQLTLRQKDEQQPVQVLFRVDPETTLPYLSRITGQHDGQAFHFEATFDYPQTGPVDVYAIGVPRDAKLIDRVPTDDVARLIAGVGAGRAQFDDYRAIVVNYSEGSKIWWMNSPNIIHRQGNRMRRDLSFAPKSLFDTVVEPAADVAVTEWWKKRATQMRYYPSRITIGGTDYVFQHRTITEPSGSPKGSPHGRGRTRWSRTRGAQGCRPPSGDCPAIAFLRRAALLKV